MAIAFKGNGSASTANSATANQASLVLTTATTAGAVGDLAVLCYAVDNNGTLDGDEGAVVAVTDSNGNKWLKAIEFTNGQAAVQAGATCGIWYSVLTAAKAIGTTVTMTFNVAASRDASAANLTYFTLASGQTVTVEAAATLANDAALAGSLNATTANIECLRIRAIATESATTTALTKTAAFTAILTQAVATTAMAIRGEYLISTSTGQASAPSGGVSADNASVYVAFKEVSPGGMYVDATAHQNLSSGTASLAITTTGGSGRIVVFVGSNGSSIGAVTATGLTFTLRTNYNPNNGSVWPFDWVYTAPYTSNFSGNISVAGITTYSTVEVVAIANANTGSTPFDSNGSLPATGAAATASGTTSNANDFVFACVGGSATATVQALHPWILLPRTGQDFSSIQYRIVSATGTFTTNLSPGTCNAILDAIKLAPAAYTMLADTGTIALTEAAVTLSKTGLPVTITGISTAVAPVGPFKVAAGDYVGSAITAAITTNTNSLLQGPGSTTLAVAQTYTNGSGSIKIGSVTFNLDKVATPTGTLYAEITQTDATGSVLATSNTVAETSITAIASPGEVVTFVFASPPTIAASATYGVVLRRTTGDLANYVRAYASSLGVYAGGIAYKHDGTSWSTVSANTDFVATVVPLITIASDTYYFFGRDGTTATTLQAFKSTAPNISWSSIATKTGFTTAILNIAAYQVGSVIHLAVLDGTSSSSVATKYLSFDATTDAFLTTVETVGTAAAITGQIIANWGVSLVVRSNGNAVIFYNGLQTNTSGTPRARLYYRERTGLNTYGTATRVDANIATDSFLPIAALGASDRIHFVFFDNNNGIQRHLTSANVLGTANSFAAARIILDVCRYDNAGVIKLVGLASGTTYRWDSADDPTITSATISLGDPARATDDGTDVWALYRSSADSDLYVKQSTDNGATFGTAISTFVGTVASTDVSLSKNQLIYQRSANVVIPYIVNDNGTLKYNEYVVRTPTVGYTLTADTGTIALSGTTVITRSLRKLLVPAQGVIAFSGQAVVPAIGMPATLGTIILSGQVNKLVYARRPVGGLGTLTLSGKDAALTPARKLPVTLGTLTLSGQTAAMRSIRRLVADTGTLTLAGQATALQSVRTLPASTGTLALSGQLAGLRGARCLPVPAQGTITAAGYDILLTKSSTVLHYTMAAAFGTVALAGQTVNYKRSYVAAPAPTAQVALSGQTAALRSVRKLAVTTGTLTLAGQANALRYGHALTAGQGTLTLAGQATTLRYARKLVVANGILTLSGQDVTLRNNNAVVAGLGILTLSGQSVTARFDRHAVVTSGTIELSGWAAALTASSAPSEMAAGLGTLTLSGQSVNFKRSYVFPVLTGTLTLSGQPVTQRAAYVLRAGAFANPPTWDPATLVNMSLSGGNLVATSTSSSTATAHVAIGTDGRASGKYYFEVTLTTLKGGVFAVDIGISSTGVQSGNFAYVDGSASGGNVITQAGTALSGMGGGSSGTVYGVAVDLNNHRIWFRKGAAGNWNANATFNPATNVGGVTLAADTYVPYVRFNSGTIGSVDTANFGATAFVGAVPAGFSPGWIADAIGTIRLSGQTAALSFGHRTVATLGTLTLAGQAVGLTRSRVMPVTTGTITLFGPVVNLINSANANKSLPAGVGVVRFAGQDAGFRFTRALTAGQGTLTLTGQIAGLRGVRTLSIGTGTLTINGQPAALQKAAAPRVMPATTGTLTLSGQTADLQYEAVAAISVETSNVIFLGQYVGLRYAPTLVVSPPLYPSVLDYNWVGKKPRARPKKWR